MTSCFIVFETNDNKLELLSVAPFLNSLDFRFKYDVELPNNAKNVTLTGNGNIKGVYLGQKPNNLFFVFKQYFLAVHVAPSGKKRYLKPIYQDDLLVNNAPDIVVRSEWVLEEDLPFSQTGSYYDFINALDAEFYSYMFFSTGKILEGDTVDQELEFSLPTLVEQGGVLEVYFKDFFAGSPLFSMQQSAWRTHKMFINNLDAKVSIPEELGKGEFHDAERKDNASTKLENPVKIINADTNTDVFANGLQRLEFNNGVAEKVNYPYWHSASRPKIINDGSTGKKNLLELTSVERLRLRNAPRLLFSGDVYGYISYTAIVNYIFFGAKRFAIISYNYDTVENVTSITAMEIESGASDANYSYENSIIFDEEKNKLINE
mgnify:CR=1 FL=1